MKSHLPLFQVLKQKLYKQIESDNHYPIVAEENGEIIGIMLCSIQTINDDYFPG